VTSARAAKRGGRRPGVERSARVELRGKRVIVVGERDGVPGTSIAKCARSAGAEVVLEQTHCFV
jgi:glycine reductase